MQRLLMGILLLGAPVLAGDLGPADLGLETIPDQQLFEKRVHCGNPMGKQPNCTIEFKDGLLVVDGMHSIRPEQVRHFALSDVGTFAKKFEIVYLSSAGQLTRAQITMVLERQINPFYKAFLAWLNRTAVPVTDPTEVAEPAS